MNSAMGYGVSSFDTIENNLVEKVGQMYSDGVGIMGTNVANMLITHNEIRNCPYTGISVGWSWDTTDQGCHDNEISYNKIYNIQQLHDDGGGIYTLGKMPGGNIHHNYISHTKQSLYHGGYPFAGIYLDNGSIYKTVQDNVCDSTVNAFYAMNLPNLNNTFKNNFYNTPLGQISNQNILQNNISVSGNNWTAGALAIIGTAGLDPAYQNILFSGIIPGKIEAENYVAMNCVMKEPATDAGYGDNVGAIDQGDWMDYFVNVFSSGNYTVNFRVASAMSGAQFEFKNGSTVLTTISVPNTGGWQTWQTVSANVNLSAGQQTLRIYSTQTSNWNINWIDAQTSTGIESVIGDQLPVQIYPNPFNSSTTIFSEMKNCSVNVVDITGKNIRSFYNVNFPFTLERQSIASGIYVLELRSENPALRDDAFRAHKVERMKLVVE